MDTPPVLRRLRREENTKKDMPAGFTVTGDT